MATVTLTTDFGEGSSYVAALKGAVLTVDPSTQLLDLSHCLPPQNLVATALFLADAIPYFPRGTIHVVVIDPGVGTDRALLCVEWNGQLILAPDNGCWMSILRPTDLSPHVTRLAEPRFWRPIVSATFHGRDILAPVAGHLSIGVTPAELGPPVTEWVSLSLAEPVATPGGFRGCVIAVDAFGNLITNIRAEAVPPLASVQIGNQPVPRIVRTYGDAEPGTLVGLIGSSGRLEVAVVCGSAATMLGFGVGTPVEVTRNV
jgi:S-adenosylmethionine hydrolase